MTRVDLITFKRQILISMIEISHQLLETKIIIKDKRDF